jgi:hypothetical protein
LQRAILAAGKFARSLQVLLRAARLYQKNHPHVLESLESADSDLRAALDRVAPFELKLDRARVIFRGQPLADPRGELKKLAEHLHRRGVFSVVFQPQTHLGELGTIVQVLAAAPLQSSDAQAPDWIDLFAQKRIYGIRINQPLVEKKADTVLTTLVAAVLAPNLSEEARRQALERPEGPDAGGAKRSAMEKSGSADILTSGLPSSGSSPIEVETSPGEASVESIDDWARMVQLLARIALPLRDDTAANPQRVLLAFRDAVSGSERRILAALAAGMTRNAPQSGEILAPYFSRLAEALAIEFAFEQFHRKRTALPELRELFLRLARELGAAGGLRPPRPGGAKWTDESYAERLHEMFWAELPAPARSEILRGPEVWCVPLATLKPYLEQLVASGNERQARSLLLHYARLLQAEPSPVRLAIAGGLGELAPLIPVLWPVPGAGPHELNHLVMGALLREAAPEVAGVLAGVADGLARLALERREFAELEKFVDALEAARAPRSGRTGPAPSAALMATLGQKLLENVRFSQMVERALEHRPLDAALPRILARDPERMIDYLGAKLATPDGLNELPAMARLLRAVGEPAFSALVTRLFDPRTQRATTAVKLLASTKPERLLDSMPRALHGWDWHLQDMAVGELLRQAVPGAAHVFSGVLSIAHPLVVPMMLDEIGMAGDLQAVPLLMDIAQGGHEHLRDVFVRIKAIEALGRLRAPEAADMLRNILRHRNGLTYSEPAGLRAAAEEALALIENHPAAARVRKQEQATAHASLSFTRPRRYLRIPLDAPLVARITPLPASPEVAAAFKTQRDGSALPGKVTTLSLGGAFVEASQRFSVGDSLDLEIRAGMRKIHGTAVVRNISPEGGGVEFVHMKQDDRERLRQFVSRLLRK